MELELEKERYEELKVEKEEQIMELKERQKKLEKSINARLDEINQLREELERTFASQQSAASKLVANMVNGKSRGNKQGELERLKRERDQALEELASIKNEEWFKKKAKAAGIQPIQQGSRTHAKLVV